MKEGKKNFETKRILKFTCSTGVTWKAGIATFKHYFMERTRANDLKCDLFVLVDDHAEIKQY